MLGATVPAKGGYYMAFKKADEWRGYGSSTKQEGIERIILALNKVLEKYNEKAKILLETITFRT